MASATYHHGNLREALLEHAVELARVGGPDAVVLRDVQRAAGVSNSAAYRHYADRRALLTAVQIHGMTLLGEAMQEALAEVPHRGPRDRRALARFRATGQASILRWPSRACSGLRSPPAVFTTPMKALRQNAIHSRSSAAASTIYSPPAYSVPGGATGSTRPRGQPSTGWPCSSSTGPWRLRTATTSS